MPTSSTAAFLGTNILLPVFNAQPGATLLLSPEWVIVGASNDYLAATLTQREVIVGQFIFDAFPDNPDTPEANGMANVRASLEQVMATRQPHEMAPQHYDVPDPARPGRFVERHWLPRHTPVLDAAGQVQFIIQSVQDITASRLAERQLHESQAGEQEARADEKAARADAETERQRFYEVLMQLPAQVAVYRGPDHVYDFVNANYQSYFPTSPLLGRPIREALPEIGGQGLFELFDQVYRTGEAFHQQEVEVQADLTHTGRLEQVFNNLLLHPLRDGEGRVTGILDFSYDVSEQVRARRQLEELNQELEARVQERTRQVREQGKRLDRLFTQAPAAICILAGPELVFELVNPIYQQFFPQRKLLGKPLLEALPELADHAAYHTTRQVYDTGKATLHQALHVPLARTADGVLEDRYFNYVQQPRYDEHGHVDGVLVFGFEVTELVQARQRAEGLQTEMLATAQRRVQERETFYQVFEQTPASVALLRGPEHRIEYHNEAYQQLFPGRHMLGRTIAEIQPDAVEQGFVGLLDGVYQTGETFFGRELQLDIEQPDGTRKENYFNFTYQAHREDGQVTGISVFAYDVSEQVRARQSREAQQRKFYTLFEQAPIGIGIFSGPDLVYEFLNDSYQQLLPGRPLLGRPLLEAMPELMGTDVERLLRRVYETGETHQQQAALIPVARLDENGVPGELEERYFTVMYQARRDEQGRINGVLDFVMEVTEQVRTQRRAEENREELKRFKFMADQARDAFILMREDGTFAYLNPKALDAWGYSAEEALHIRVPDVDPIYIDAVFNEAFAQAQRGTIPPFETLHKHKSGRIFPVEVNMGGLQLDGQPYMFAIARDITEQKRYVAALEESEARFRTMADAAPNMVWAVNPDSTIRYVNRAFLDFVGLADEAAYTATGWRPYLHPDELELTQRILTQAIEQRQTYVLEHRMRRHDGQYRWLLAQGAPSFLPGGELYGYVGSAIDITDLKQANEQLRRTNVDLDNFIYTASHDLKAPISNIEGLLYLLQEELPPAVTEAPLVGPTLTRMLDAVERFKRTISHLTDVSKLQKEHTPDAAQVNLAAVVEDVRQDLAPLLQETGATLVVDVSALPPVQFSEKNLRSIVYNLLSNALKYRHPDRAPRVDVRAHVQPDFTVLEVHDNGLGIAPRQLPKLFGMFQRFHDHVDGSGIGLYMVKRMVENAGGRIEVRSQLGVGTTFFVHLPHGPAPGAA